MSLLYAIGILTNSISKQNKRLGDYLAGIVVVHEKPLPTAQFAWQASSTSYIAAKNSQSNIPGSRPSSTQLVPADDLFTGTSCLENCQCLRREMVGVHMDAWPGALVATAMVDFRAGTFMEWFHELGFLPGGKAN